MATAIAAAGSRPELAALKKPRMNPWGIFSVIASYLTVTVIAWQLGGFHALLQVFNEARSGDLLNLRVQEDSLLDMLPLILASAVFALPLAIGSYRIVALIIGDLKGAHALSAVEGPREQIELFKVFFVTVFLEELFARQLFLGWIWQIPGLHTTTGFLVLFLLGNGIWALVHLLNFKDGRDRHWARVAPQFVGGTVFTYVFLKYGLLGSVLAHFAYNAILLASDKKQRVDHKDFLITAFWGFYALVSYNMMEKPLSDILVWFREGNSLVLQGWGIMDHVWMTVFISSIFAVAAGLMLFDTEDLKAYSNDKRSGFSLKVSGIGGFIALPFALALTLALVLGIVLGIMLLNYWIAGLFVDSEPVQILTAAIMLCFTRKCMSLSAVSRVFWIAVPTGFVSLASILALYELGTLVAVKYLIVSMLIGLPAYIVRQLND